ncbi:MAG: ribonuclease E/G [Gemmatimonadales bacterium]
MEDDHLVELMVDRPDVHRSVGNIYLGKVEAVLPGMQAAFVDIGSEKSGFLHSSDLIEAEEDDENGNNRGNGRGRGRRGSRNLPKIEDHIKRGQSLLVQVTKEPISTKGPRVTAQISLAGRFLVYMPLASRIGVSRKIASREERQRLKQMVAKFLPKNSGGVIVRTVAEDLTEDLVKREIRSLLGLWKKISRKAHFVRNRVPALVQREASLTSGIIRDMFSDKVDRLFVDSRTIYKEIHRYLRQVDPDLRSRVEVYNGSETLFDKFGIEDEIRAMFRRRVDLPSGGYLIIEPTEALVSIDVNTGSYTGKKNHENTILKTNLDAAREIARQLRLRDIGGIIVIDFIDMEIAANRKRVFQEIKSHLVKDRARTRAFEVSDLGLIEMTRQRVRPSLRDSMTMRCTDCKGTGHTFRPEVVARRLERAMRRVAHEKKEKRMTVRLHPEVALYLLEKERDFAKEMRRLARVELEIRDDPVTPVDEFRLVSQPAGRDVTGEYDVA